MRPIVNNIGDLTVFLKGLIILMGDTGLFGKGYRLHSKSFFAPCSLHMNAIGTVQPKCKYMLRDLLVKVWRNVDFYSTQTGMLSFQWYNKKLICQNSVHSL